MNKKPTLTIGIPAYNEENNIANLIESILFQKQENFMLEKIIVACDGCNDKTEDIVKNIVKRNKNIQLVSGKKRLGKSTRLNQLHKLNKSDFILTIDGDVILSEQKVLAKMIHAFNSNEVLAVAANNQPVNAETFIEKIYNAGYKMWYEIRKDYKGGDNLNNVQGMATCLKKSFAKKIGYPKTTGDGAYLFLMTMKHKGKLRFVKDAVVLFNSPNNFDDILVQASRNLRSKHMLANHLGVQVYKEQKIPKTLKIKGILKSIFSDPFYTILAIILNIWIRRHLIEIKKIYKRGVWKISKSTKRGINKLAAEGSLA